MGQLTLNAAADLSLKEQVCIAKKGYGEEASSKEDSSECFAADQVFSSRHYALRQQSRYILACEPFRWLQRDRSAALKVIKSPVLLSSIKIVPVQKAKVLSPVDLLKKYYLGTPVSPVPLKVVLALEQLSKLKPSLGSKDVREMLTLCCKNIVSHPSAEMMLKIRESHQAAQYLQLLQTSLKALGQLMVVLLETETTRGFFQNIVHVLQRSVTSNNVWERKRALQTCSQLLAACEELPVSKEPHCMLPAPSPVLEGEFHPAVHAVSWHGEGTGALCKELIP
ncbi:uncharacterized protein LOC116229831 [Phasianus colchicus]|uniref:uncharacterized protein LOC116229831 n=1 Tax=Phasianus colchicus TaxID=9054 RepID=UPI00129E413B|nr:uncharacterized protein LOC116229831 [Phasianus colchicus]